MVLVLESELDYWSPHEIREKISLLNIIEINIEDMCFNEHEAGTEEETYKGIARCKKKRKGKNPQCRHCLKVLPDEEHEMNSWAIIREVKNYLFDVGILSASENERIEEYDRVNEAIDSVAGHRVRDTENPICSINEILIEDEVRGALQQCNKMINKAWWIKLFTKLGIFNTEEREKIYMDQMKKLKLWIFIEISQIRELLLDRLTSLLPEEDLA